MRVSVLIQDTKVDGDGFMLPRQTAEPSIAIPVDTNDRGTVRERAVRATRWLWSRGIYPSPSAMSARLHGVVRTDLNDRECRGRREAMQALGVPLQRKYLAREPVG